MANNENQNDQERLIDRAINEYESALINYANSIIRDSERAKDVVQERSSSFMGKTLKRYPIPLNLGCSQYVGIDVLTLLGKKNA